MLILGASTSEKVQLVTSTAASIRAHVSFITVDASTPPVVQNIDSDYIAAITGIATTDIKAGHATHKTRIGFMSFRNEHASLACDCTVQLYDGTNTETLIKAALLAGETLAFDGARWTHYGTNGEPYSQSVKLDKKLYVASDVINATTSFADVTGLTVALLSARKYAFEANIFHINNATTTGSRFAVNIGAAPTVLQVATIDTVTASVTASVHSAGATAALDTAITAQTTGSVAITLAYIAGYIQPSADGTFAIRCQSEVAVAAGLTVKAGSWLRIWEVD